MMTPRFYCSVCWLILILQGAQGQFVTLEASPQEINVGTTKTLNIKCSVPQGKAVGIEYYVSIYLQHSAETSRPFKAIALLNESRIHNFGVPNSMVSGGIHENTKSFLKIVFNDPQQREAGVYKCLVNALEYTGHLVQWENSITVEISGGGGGGETRSRAKNSLEFEGKKYILSPKTRQLDANVAEEECHEANGYLMEIDTEAELEVIVKFLESFPDYYSVLTGGWDEQKEGEWRYRYSGTLLKVQRWGHLQPDDGREGNCLHLWNNNGNWKMSDEHCITTPDFAMDVGYLCEIPQ